MELYFGHFLSHPVRAPIAQPIGNVRSATVIRTEETGSDVNLAVHLLNDGWLDAYDCAVVVSNDSDLAEAMRLVRQQDGKRIGLVTPGAGRTSQQLKRHADFSRRIRSGHCRVPSCRIRSRARLSGNLQGGRNVSVLVCGYWVGGVTRAVPVLNDLSKMTLRDLLGLHAGVMGELQRLGVARNENNPTGNLAEFLFCRAYGWQREPNSEKRFSASDRDGVRYRIKGRRLHRRNASRQLSALRDLDGFEMLAAVLLDD